ncbi:MAG: GH25 family lysozyme, partial [Acinetobacter sp.]
MPKRPVKKQRQFTRYGSIFAIGLLCGVISISLAIFYHNSASAETYPIKGFDVSHHQGVIDWKKISPQQYQFVYLKATEGGDYQDDQFQNYWMEARERGMHVGAYHFYRLCRDGKIQAQNFIETVPNKSNALPPVIDLEYD